MYYVNGTWIEFYHRLSVHPTTNDYFKAYLARRPNKNMRIVLSTDREFEQEVFTLSDSKVRR
jgi:hypothetical protein